MHQFETTSTYSRNDSNIPKRHAHYLQNMKTMRITAVMCVVMGVAFGAAALRYSVVAAVICFAAFGFVASICIPVGSWSSRRVAANFYEDGDDLWTNTTWFENDGIHRIDDEADEDVFPLNKLVCAYRAGDVLLLCSATQSVIPVNLAQLSETDRKSVFQMLKTGCPKLKAIQQR